MCFFLRGVRWQALRGFSFYLWASSELWYNWVRAVFLRHGGGVLWCSLGEVHIIGFVIHKGVGWSWGDVYNMRFVVCKGVRKSNNFESQGIQNFCCSQNKQGCFPNASMLQTMMQIKQPPHVYQQVDKDERPGNAIMEMGSSRALR